MTFNEGDVVEVWSKSKHRWLRGHILSVALSKEEGAAAGAGEVKIKLGTATDSLEPGEFDTLRHCVEMEHLPVDPEAPPCCCLRALRKRHFSQEGGTLRTSAGGEHLPRIGMSTLETIWLDALQEEQPEALSSRQDQELVRHRVKKSFQDLRAHFSLGSSDLGASVDLCEWLHHALMRIHHPGPDAAKTIANELAAQEPKRMSRLVKRWMLMDTTGTGMITLSDLTEAFKEEFRPKLSHKVAEMNALAMLRDMDAQGKGRASYSEFVLRMLGIESHEVIMYWYDLSNDWAKYLSPLLLGSWEGGLWHTGVSVFGREYFYGGRICWGPPGATVWGRPTKAVRLGLTTRRLDELREHIFTDLDRKFDRKSYDVLDRNCNHFVDDTTQFLLGMSIPDEVRLQPQRLMNAPIAKMMRPLLNHWLGRVEEGPPQNRRSGRVGGA